MSCIQRGIHDWYQIVGFYWLDNIRIILHWYLLAVLTFNNIMSYIVIGKEKLDGIKRSKLVMAPSPPLIQGEETFLRLAEENPHLCGLQGVLIQMVSSNLIINWNVLVLGKKEDEIIFFFYSFNTFKFVWITVNVLHLVAYSFFAFWRKLIPLNQVHCLSHENMYMYKKKCIQ